MDELSHDDLIEYALDLQRQIDEKDDEIAELTQNQTGKKGKRGGNVAQKEELEALETENEDLRSQIESGQLLISDLREQVSNANLKIGSLTTEKAESDKKIRAQTKRLEELEKEIVEVNNRGRSAELQSKEFNKQKSANVKEAQRLWEENESLKEEIKALEGQMQTMEEDKVFMESLIAKFADEKEELETKFNNADVEMDEMQSGRIELEKLLEETQLRLQASIEAEGELEQRIGTVEQELRAARDKAALDAKAAQAETKTLKEQIAVLKDSTKVGEKQRALETLQAETADNNRLIAELQSALEGAETERDLLAEKLLDLEHSIEQRVVDRIAVERNKAKELGLTIESLKTHHAENLEHYQQLEDEKAALVREVDELSNWKAVYEAGHGLQEMSRNQKKLKDDNRRLGVAVEQYNNKLSMVMDANGVLTQAFEKLKREAGKPADFSYPEYALQNEVLSTNASLQSQLRELEEQVISLEKENTRIRGAMKNQAASIGEQGFKYAGMTPDMLLQVNDFAANLREGKIELPLNDRSQVLLKENRTLKADAEAMKLKLERYERELGGAVYSPRSALPSSGASAAGTGTGGAGGGGAPLTGGPEGELHEDFQRLADENSALHAKMNALQSDLSQLLQRPAAAAQVLDTGAAAGKAPAGPGSGSEAPGMISVAELSNILMQNNQLMLREMDSMRRSQPTAGGYSQPQQYQQYQHEYMQDSAAATAPTAPASGRSGPLAAAMSRAHSSYKSSGPAAGVASAVTGAGAGGSTAHPSGSTVTFAGVPSTPGGPPHRAGGVGVAGVPNTPLWTPAIGRGGMPFSSAGGGPMLPGPATPHGKQLLNNTLHQLNLPPEEWALDVRDLNSQLIECLEQLYEREQELEDTNTVVSTLEENLVAIKQQMTALYYDYAQRSDSWEAREAAFKKEAAALNDERDDLRLKLRRMQDMAELLQKEDKESIGLQLTDLTRKVTIYEVNEAVLSRKYIAQSEQLQQEQAARQLLEGDFVEMESSLKKRILYLEQYKLAAGARIGHLQGRVDSSVSQGDYLALQAEIDVLREDHLNTLRREVEARMSALKALDQARELRSARIIIAHMQADLEGTQRAKVSCESELVHQREVTSRALAAAGSSAEVSQLVSELARFRGEASRLEVELMASNRRAELIGERVQEVSREAEASASRVHELERREDELSAKESAARKAALEMQLKFEGGMTRDEAEEWRAKLSKAERSLEEAKREVLRHRELAEIASQQAQALSSFRKANETELTELREYCTRLESRSDDELLIGRLQRKLMSTTTSYKAFTRKYHQAREAMRKRELGMRLLESRLDEQDRAVLKAQETSRLEVNALKKALLNLKNTVFESKDPSAGGAKSTSTTNAPGAANPASSRAAKAKKIKTLARAGIATVTVGEKLVDVSVKVDALAVQAEEAVNRAAECEDECRELKGKLEDLLAERYILEQRARDLEAVTKGKSKQQAIASRLIALSDDVRANKIAYLQQRRQVQVLRQEKRHLQSIISNIEADVMELEEGKVNAETKHILFDINEKTSGLSAEEEDEFSSAMLNLTVSEEPDLTHKRSQGRPQSASGTSHDDIPQRPATAYKSSSERAAETGTELSLDMDMISPEKKDITPDELYHKLKVAHGDLAAARRELSDFKLRAGALQTQLGDLEALLQERDGQVNYYERVLAEEGLPAVLLRNQNRRSQPPGSGNGSRPHRLMQDEQEKLQEAASATIGSLRALLEEKNRIIDKYRDRLEKGSGVPHHNKSRAERRADELLDRIAADETEEARARRYGVALHPEVFSTGIGHASEAERQHHQKLLQQIEQADSIISEKDRTLQQLEQRLLAESNQRERAEIRCGESIKEMDAMKEDMMLLLKQLQDSQALNAHLSKTTSTRAIVPPSDNPRLKELEKAVRAKEAKVQNYREALLKLKDEFMKTEEAAAAEEVRHKAREAGEHGPAHKEVNMEDMKALQRQVKMLQEGLRGAKEDVDKAHRSRERLVSEKKLAEEAALKCQEDTHKAEAQLANAQGAYHRLRRELEDSRKKEVRLKEKLKEALEGGGGAGKESVAKFREAIESLERENDLLKTQLAALKPSSGGGGGKGAHSAAESKEDGGKSVGGGQVLGTGGGPVDEVRKLQHEKWEQDKKLQKRVTLLEERLAEHVSTNKELQAQVVKGRETLQAALSAKEELSRKAQASQKVAQETRRMTADDLTELEQSNAKIFALEEEMVHLRRKAHVEQINEISALNHQVSVQRARIAELEAEVADSEMRRKRASANTSGGAGRSLRDSEDQYHREMRLKDDLELAKHQKLELEAALLERDSRHIASQFDLDAAGAETDRLKRRVRELEHAYKGLSALTQQGPLKGPGATLLGGAGAGSSAGAKKEQELEGALEAMRRVVDKLKTENDRLKRGGGGTEERRLAELEKKLQAEKKRSEGLDEENKALHGKLKGHEESVQKIVQRQQQVAVLRKQLKSKEDELSAAHEQAEGVIVERETLKKRMSGLQDKVNELEIALHKARQQQQQQGGVGGGGGRTSTAPGEVSRELQEMRNKAAAQASENDTLRAQLSDLRRSLQEMQQREEVGGGGGGGGGRGSAALSGAEVQRLKEENTKLRQELSAFDLDFFEEIENLKYAHAEAVRKLRMYEGAGAGGGSGGAGRLGSHRS